MPRRENHPDQSNLPTPVMSPADHDHSDCLCRVLDAVEGSCELNRLNLTPVRRRSLEILLESHRALGAYDLLERLRLEGFGSKPVTAYRALDFLMKNGFVHRIEGLNAYVACMHPSESHTPAFMVCRTCRAVAEAQALPQDAALGRAAESVGFSIENTVVEVMGLCAACQSGAET